MVLPSLLCDSCHETAASSVASPVTWIRWPCSIWSQSLLSQDSFHEVTAGDSKTHTNMSSSQIYKHLLKGLSLITLRKHRFNCLYVCMCDTLLGQKYVDLLTAEWWTIVCNNVIWITFNCKEINGPLRPRMKS